MNFKILIILAFLGPGYSGYAQNAPVYISGTCPDSTINVMNIQKSAMFWWGTPGPYFAKMERQEDSTFSAGFFVDDSQFASLGFIGGHFKIFISPGDSVNFKIYYPEKSRSQIHFTGKNAAHYNFFPELIKSVSLGIDMPLNTVNAGNLKEYKEKIDARYKRSIAFFEDYAAKHKISEVFARLAKTEIEYERCYRLYEVRSYIPKKDIPDWYFKDVDRLPFQDDDLLKSMYFRMALLSKYVRGYTENPWENFSVIFKNITDNFSGEIKGYLIAYMIGYYADKQGQGYHDDLLKSVEYAKNNISNELFLKYISMKEEYYLMIDKPFPDTVLNNTYLKEFDSDKIISFKDMLTRYKGKAVYLDFWASWCSPCRIDIAESGEAKEYFKERNVTPVYISIDKDEHKWKKASTEDHIEQDQYLLIDKKSSPLNKYLGITSIPRYVLIDKNHVLKYTDAPRPNRSQLNRLKKSISIMQQKVYTY